MQLFSSLAFLISVCAAAAYQTTYEGGLTITSGNVTLLADGYIPVTTSPSAKFPLVVFCNSWAMPQFEYVLEAALLASEGYVTLEYEARGWYLSGGEIDVAGPLDIQDGMNVISYALSRSDWPVDPTRIAFAGISYGAGIGLQVAGSDPRVKTVVAMSGWANVTNALMYNGSPNKVWGGLLELLADLLGHPQPSLSQLYNDVISHTNLSYVDAFCAVRSPLRFVPTFNSRNVPVFLSHNFLDRLFLPEDTIQLYELLTCPKYMLLNQGIHAEAELPGLLDDPNNYPWVKARMWLDFWLKNISNGIMQEAPVQMQLASLQSNDYQMFSQWPDPTAVTPTTLYLMPRDGNQFGGLSPTMTFRTSYDSISFTLLPPLTDGIDVVADVLAPILPVTVDLGLTSTRYSAVYVGTPLSSSLQLCGTPSVNITVIPNAVQWQIYGFLYKVDLLDIGTLVTDFAYTHWADGVPRSTYQVTADFHTICQTLPSGHRVGFGLVLYNDLFQPANATGSLSVSFIAATSSITLPVNV